MQMKTNLLSEEVQGLESRNSLLPYVVIWELNTEPWLGGALNVNGNLEVQSSTRVGLIVSLCGTRVENGLILRSNTYIQHVISIFQIFHNL